MSKHEAGTPDNISLGLFNITKNDNNTKEGHLETGRANANISGEDDNGDAKMDLHQEEEKIVIDCMAKTYYHPYGKHEDSHIAVKKYGSLETNNSGNKRDEEIENADEKTCDPGSGSTTGKRFKNEFKSSKSLHCVKHKCKTDEMKSD